MAKHHFPHDWSDPERGVRFMCSNGDLWNCETAEAIANVGREIEVGDTFDDDEVAVQVAVLTS